MKKLSATLFCLTFCLCLNAQLPVNLGTSANFSVLGGTTVTNIGNTVVNGNLGVSPGNAVTGFGPGIVINGSVHLADAVAAQAQTDLTAAYNDAASRACPVTNLPADIGGAAIMPGIFCAASAVMISTPVTLNGNGNSNAVFIFQIPSALTVANSAVVNLIGGAQASNIFWQVGSSATIGTSAVFNGSILAFSSITINTSAVMNGRALARNAAVTLAGNAVSNPGTSGPASGVLAVACPVPSGAVGQPYLSATIGSGGTPPYSYSIGGGGLPTNLSLNTSSGAISGTPTVPGTFPFTARVVDATTLAATNTCTAFIIAPAPAPPPPTPAPSSLILVATALVCVGIYQARGRILNLFGRN